MAKSSLTQQIARKGSNKARLADIVVRDPDLLAEVLDGQEAATPEVRYGCLKVLMLVGEKAPALLYPHFAFFVGLLQHPNHFLQWGAIRILGQLASRGGYGW